MTEMSEDEFERMTPEEIIAFIGRLTFLTDQGETLSNLHEWDEE